MTEAASIQPRPISLDKPLTIAILAMGGQGGGVLADWIVEVAEHVGWAAQSTSVPGVAQRTGATIYYIETLPPRKGVAPVFSLMPTPGDVDVVMAAELMEAGRSVLRGLVTPDKTTLIASTHRAYAVAEKEKPGDGAGDSFVVVDALDFAARRTIAFDMEKLAVERGTVISAAMLGALAGSGALPFERSAYEDIVQKGARGANASLAAFADAFDRAREGKNEAPNTGPQQAPRRFAGECRPSGAQSARRALALGPAGKRASARLRRTETHRRFPGRGLRRRLYRPAQEARRA